VAWECTLTVGRQELSPAISLYSALRQSTVNHFAGPVTIGLRQHCSHWSSRPTSVSVQFRLVPTGRKYDRISASCVARIFGGFVSLSALNFLWRFYVPQSQKSSAWDLQWATDDHPRWALSPSWLFVGLH